MLAGYIKSVVIEYTRPQVGLAEAPVMKVRVTHRGEAIGDYGIEATGDKGHIPHLNEIIDAKNKAQEIFKDQSYMEETKFE